MSFSGQTVVMIADLHSIGYRNFAARPLLTSGAGMPTNAIRGVLEWCDDAMAEVGATALVVAKEGRGSIRKEIYSGYKRTRGLMDREYVMQIPVIEQALNAFGFSVLAHDGWEADDTIASLCRANRQSVRYFFTYDKDLLQLVTESVYAYRRIAKKGVIYDASFVSEKMGVPPSGLLDLFSASGDTQDDIPGIPDVGVGFVRKVLSKYPSFEYVFAHLDEMPETISSRLRGMHDRFMLARQLANLRDNLPIPADILIRRPRNEDELWELEKLTDIKGLSRRFPAERHAVTQQFAFAL